MIFSLFLLPGYFSLQMLMPYFETIPSVHKQKRQTHKSNRVSLNASDISMRKKL